MVLRLAGLRRVSEASCPPASAGKALESAWRRAASRRASRSILAGGTVCVLREKVSHSQGDCRHSPRDLVLCCQEFGPILGGGGTPFVSKFNTNRTRLDEKIYPRVVRNLAPRCQKFGPPLPEIWCSAARNLVPESTGPALASSFCIAAGWAEWGRSVAGAQYMPKAMETCMLLVLGSGAAPIEHENEHEKIGTQT